MSAEPLPQRRLILELRFAIDHAMAYPNDRPRSVNRVRDLVAAHPKALQHIFVRKGVGKARLEWVEKEVLHAAE